MFISVTAIDENNRVIKYQEFEAQADAEAHAAEHGGSAVARPEGNPLFWYFEGGAAVFNEEASLAAKKENDLRVWFSELQKTDAALPRAAEDLIDLLKTKGVLEDADLPTKLKENYDAKKLLRSQKPQ